MSTLIVVNTPRHWPLHIPGVDVVASRIYLTDPHFAHMRTAKVFNLSRSYRYQSMGYYVSLLATARGHRPLPDIGALQDMRSARISRVITEDMQELIQRSLRGIHPGEFVLSIYFGKNTAKRYDRLTLKLFNMFQAPLLRAYFVYKKEWVLQRVTPIPASEIPESHREFVMAQANTYFRRKRIRPSLKTAYRCELAILHDPEEKFPPSNRAALRRFMNAAEDLRIRPELVTRDDYGRLGEFDALFIRATTQVNNYTYQFARRAEAEGLAVMDDPESIIRCSNKVFLAEALRRKKIPAPRTFIAHEAQIDDLKKKLPYPCVLKLPDGSFSTGVVKVETPGALAAEAERVFERSDLLVIQEFIPTGFDWRIGILDGRALYACKYHMAGRHWQIRQSTRSGRSRFGRVESFSLRRVPPLVLKTALAASRLIGGGLYGVDLKEVGGRVYVIEVNDNPNIDTDCEDIHAPVGLYRKIMASLLRRVEHIRRSERYAI